MVTLRQGELVLAPLTWRDQKKWQVVRARNRTWLEKWEATRPQLPGHLPGAAPAPSYFAMIRSNKIEARAKRNFTFGIWLVGPHQECPLADENPEKNKKELIGQITLGGIVFGALRAGHIGYWIDEGHANRGLMTRAVKIVVRYAFQELGLHRLEINCRPENGASAAVAEKAGFIFEGDRPRFLHIDGDWRDHHVYVLENPAVK
jgi:[ribosomal protein S5]-alanine N-acetyltransferase